MGKSLSWGIFQQAMMAKGCHRPGLKHVAFPRSLQQLTFGASFNQSLEDVSFESVPNLMSLSLGNASRREKQQRRSGSAARSQSLVG